MIANCYDRIGRRPDVLGNRIYQISCGFNINDCLVFCKTLTVIRMNTTLKS